MLSMIYVRHTIKVKVGIPESFKVGWYPYKITGSSHLKIRLFSLAAVLVKHCSLFNQLKYIHLLDLKLITK